MNTALLALHDSALAQLLRGANPLLVISFQLLHIIGLLVLLTAVLLLALRLFGLGLRQQSPQEVAELARPLQRWGLLTVALSGAALFISNPLVYAANPALQIKLVLLLLAVILQAGLLRWLLQGKPVFFARTGALASLLLWGGTGLAGRAIGFI